MLALWSTLHGHSKPEMAAEGIAITAICSVVGIRLDVPVATVLPMFGCRHAAIAGAMLGPVTPIISFEISVRLYVEDKRIAGQGKRN